MTTTLPELPREKVDVTWDARFERTADIVVRAGDNLQAALDQVQPGQIIELEAGATFVGATQARHFKLKNKGTNHDWIIIRSSGWQNLAVDRRVEASDAQHMATLKAHPNEPQVPILEAHFGANHYRLVGIRFYADFDCNQLIRFGTYLNQWTRHRPTKEDDLPRDITVDRCIVEGHPEFASRKGIELDGIRVAVINSRIIELHSVQHESQCILSWCGKGPVLIQNNQLEGAAENVMFGGSDPTIPNLVPGDIEIRQNTFKKLNEWRQPIPTGKWKNSYWMVKNLLEFKNACRVLIHGNIFQHNWPTISGPGQQPGNGLVNTPRNQSGTAPWSCVQDITYEFNALQDSTHTMNLLAGDNFHPSQTLKRILFKHNLFVEIADRMISVNNNQSGIPPMEDVTFIHNTAVHRGPGRNFMFFDWKEPAIKNFLMRDNLMSTGSSGNHCPGPTDFDSWVQQYDVSNNGFWSSNRYIPTQGNTFYSSTADVRFEDPDNHQYRLLDDSPAKGMATDGSDLGADIDALEKAVQGIETEPPVPPIDPIPPVQPPTQPPDIADLEKRVSDLEGEVSALQTQTSDQQTEITDLKTTTTGHETRLSKSVSR